MNNHTPKELSPIAHERLIIIGSGPAALTAALYAARAQLKPFVFEGDKPGGQLMSTTAVENWPGEVSIMGPELMMNMRTQAGALGTRFSLDMVTHVDTKTRPFIVTTSKNKRFSCDALIVATGAKPKQLNCPGEQEYWAKGVSTCAVCDGALYRNKKVVIIGGGDTAMEDASFMTHFTDNVTIIHILDKLTASQPMQKRVVNNPKISIIYSAQVKQFLGKDHRLSSVEIEHTVTKKTETIEADAAFLAIGLTPATELFRDVLELSPSGHILHKKHTETSLEGIFAAGDVADARYRQAITSAGFGCMAALDAERYLSSLQDKA